MAQSTGNVVLVGKKGTMNYVLAVVIQFNQGANSVVIKARGRAISKAVDVAEIVKTRFMPEQVDVKKVSIGTEQVGTGEQMRNVSTIEIVLERKS
ncbi:MAG: DNA-binding protein Alba [archaeon GB-1867-035]|nr:DNA-binding protein Alba [Candidatus Culexmicrobium profundum]